MKLSNSILKLWLLTVVATTSVGCMESAVKNGEFEAWCGDDLCLWQTDEGTIEKVPTWHKHDVGVSFTGDPTIISQRVESDYIKCYMFTILANVEDDAALYFELDYLDDDLLHPDFSQQVVAPDWNKVNIDVAVPSWCDVFRLILRKTGSGKVVAASIAEGEFDSCPLTIPDDERPAGVPCETDDQCKGGICDEVCQ